MRHNIGHSNIDFPCIKQNNHQRWQSSMQSYVLKVLLTHRWLCEYLHNGLKIILKQLSYFGPCSKYFGTDPKYFNFDRV